jgi:hypothetical protein
MLTTTPTSRPASWPNNSANGVGGAGVGGAGVGGAGAGVAGEGAGVAGGGEGADVTSGAAGAGAAAVGAGLGVACGCAPAGATIGRETIAGAAIPANNASEAATMVPRRLKTLTGILPCAGCGQCSAAASSDLALAFPARSI